MDKDTIERQLWCDVYLQADQLSAGEAVLEYREFFSEPEPDAAPETFTLDVEWPDWARYAAMDSDGRWFFYDAHPGLAGSFWIAGNRGGDVEKFTHPPHPSYWKDSLIVKDAP